MDQSSRSQPGGRPNSPKPQVGRVSQFVGGRLLMIWLLAGIVGLVMLILAGFKLWLVVTRGTTGSEVISLVALACLAWALLSISGSARRSGLKYLQGEKAVGRDLLRFAVHRLERRRRAR
jgi:hypothetical protein